MEIDPDLLLYARLSVGTGKRLATTVSVWLVGLWLLSTRRYVFFQFFRNAADASADPGFFQVALIVLILAPARAVARLLDLEQGGLLDQTRLCARRPHRVLAAFLVGATGPFVLLAGVLLINHLRLAGQPGTTLLALIVFVGSLGASLIAYGALPPTMTLDSRFITPLLFLVGAVSFAIVRLPEWVQQLAFDTLAARLTMIAVVALLIAGVWLARRRIERAPQPLSRSAGVSLPNLLSRLVPDAGPPEFNRQLRSALLSGGTLVTMLIAPVVMLAGVRVSETAAFRLYSGFSLNGVPYALVLIGAFAASMTARREVEASTIDFVRLTPQHAEGVIASWYAALSLPYWIAALVAVATLKLAAPALFGIQWPLVALAALWPALSLAEGLQRRKPGTYLWLPFALFMLLGTLVSVLRPVPFDMQVSLMRRGLGAAERRAVLAERARTLPGGEWRRFDTDEPYQAWLLATLAIGVSLGAAAGRLRRADGPSLAGPACAAGVCAIVFTARQLPLMAYPSVLPGMLAVMASLFAEERHVPTSPWRRASIGAAAAIAASLCATRIAGISWIGSAVVAAAGACAFVAALLGHELTWRTPLISLGLRLTAFAALATTWWRVEVSPRGLPSFPADVSPMLTGTELTLFAAAVVVAAALHVRARSRAPGLYFPRHA